MQVLMSTCVRRDAIITTNRRFAECYGNFGDRWALRNSANMGLSGRLTKIVTPTVVNKSKRRFQFMVSAFPRFHDMPKRD